jgi:hypothetical protein
MDTRTKLAEALRQGHVLTLPGERIIFKVSQIFLDESFTCLIVPELKAWGDREAIQLPAMKRTHEQTVNAILGTFTEDQIEQVLPWDIQIYSGGDTKITDVRETRRRFTEIRERVRHAALAGTSMIISGADAKLLLQLIQREV